MHGQDTHIHQVAVICFHCHGHVVLMHQKAVIGRRHFIGGNELVLRQFAGRRKQGGQLL